MQYLIGAGIALFIMAIFLIILRFIYWICDVEIRLEELEEKRGAK